MRRECRVRVGDEEIRETRQNDKDERENEKYQRDDQRGPTLTERELDWVRVGQPNPRGDKSETQQQQQTAGHKLDNSERTNTIQ